MYYLNNFNIFSFNSFVLKADTITLQDQKEYLLQSGYTSMIVNHLPDEKINEIYNRIYKKNVIVTSTCKSYSITNPDIQTRALSDQLYINILFEATYNSNNVLTKLLVTTGALWSYNGAPAVTGKEGHAINWESSDFSMKGGSLTVLNNVTCICGGKTSRTDKEIVEAPIGGIGFRSSFVTKCSKCGRTTLLDRYNMQHFFFNSIELNPKSNVTIKKGSGFNSQINYTYGHNQNPFGFNVGITIKGVGVTLTGSLVDKLATVGQFVA